LAYFWGAVPVSLPEVVLVSELLEEVLVVSVLFCLCFVVEELL
jgi:hypothetical protein